ncbi:MAG: SusE domain-containing protein [Bacteroidia bacterium]|nr:SusE domain-containing protein [Bacteroidia bacterium]
MKNLLIWGAAALTSSLLFSACETDRDDNPTIKVPESFQLFTPATANLTLDLKQSNDVVTLTYEEAQFGFPCVQTYVAEISKNEAFAAEETYLINQFTSTVNSIELGLKEINTGLNSLYAFAKEETPEELSVYLRMVAKVGTAKSYSNAIKLSFKPYFFDPAAANALPELWWFIGSCIADGSWGKDGVYPLALSADKTKLQSTVYLTSAGFKMVKTPGSWDNQIGQGASFGEFTVNDGGSGNITPDADGYYVVTLTNTDGPELSIKPIEGDDPEVKEAMYISGNFNGWSADATPMKAINTVEGVNNHIWMYELPAVAETDAAADGFIKFKLNPGWIGPNDATSIYAPEDFEYEVDGDGNFALSESASATATKIYYNDIDKTYTIVK